MFGLLCRADNLYESNWVEGGSERTLISDVCI